MRLTKSVAVGAASALFLVVLSAPDLRAQSLPLKVTIPFAFHVADRTLPAGAYIVQTSGDAIRIHDRLGHSATVLSSPVWRGRNGDDKDVLIFSQYGKDFFLSEARWQGYSNARGVVKSRAEKQLAQGVTPSRVNIASVLP